MKNFIKNSFLGAFLQGAVLGGFIGLILSYFTDKLFGL